MNFRYQDHPTIETTRRHVQYRRDGGVPAMMMPVITEEGLMFRVSWGKKHWDNASLMWAKELDDEAKKGYTRD